MPIKNQSSLLPKSQPQLKIKRSSDIDSEVFFCQPIQIQSVQKY